MSLFSFSFLLLAGVAVVLLGLVLGYGCCRRCDSDGVGLLAGVLICYPVTVWSCVAVWLCGFEDYADM